MRHRDTRATRHEMTGIRSDCALGGHMNEAWWQLSQATSPAEAWIINMARGVFDPVHRMLASSSKAVRLSPLESDALFQLATSRGSACTMEQLAKAVWGSEDAAKTSACRQLIRSLRLKLADCDVGIALVHTADVGYRLTSVESPIDQTGLRPGPSEER